MGEPEMPPNGAKKVLSPPNSTLEANPLQPAKPAASSDVEASPQESRAGPDPVQKGPRRRRRPRPRPRPPPRAPPTPPDGGWGWVVVLSSFMISVLVDGLCFSAGIFFNPFKNHYGATKAETAWVGSVLNGSYLSVGPLVSACVNRYGCRKMAMFGSVFAAVAFFISTFSPTMPVLIVTYGMLGGIGFGFVYLPAIVMVGYYFEKRRALATGIACCGSGIGAFLFAPISNLLLEEYSWKGATWIMSGLMLNGLVFGIFYRPLEQVPKAASLSEDSAEKGEEREALLNGDRASGALVAAASSPTTRKKGLDGRERDPQPPAALSRNAETEAAKGWVEVDAEGGGTSNDPATDAGGRPGTGGPAKPAAAHPGSPLSPVSVGSGDTRPTTATPLGTSPGSSARNGEPVTGLRAPAPVPVHPAVAYAAPRSSAALLGLGVPLATDLRYIEVELLENGKGVSVTGREALKSLGVESSDTDKGSLPGIIASLIQTAIPKTRKVHASEAKAFFSDTQLNQPALVARMAFSQDGLFKPPSLRQRHPGSHRGPQQPYHHHPDHRQRPSEQEVNGPLQRKDIFYSGSLRNIPEFVSSGSLAEYRQMVTTRSGLAENEEMDGDRGVSEVDEEEEMDGDRGVSEVDEEEEEVPEKRPRSLCHRFVLDPLLVVFDVSLLKSPTFVIYGLSCFLCMLGFFVPFIYLPTLCGDLGIANTEAAFLISIIGIANTVGRVAVGFVSDLQWVDCLLINNLALVLGGAVTCLVPFLKAYALFAAYAFVFGTAIAVFVSLRSIIMVELMGLQKLTNAFGLVIMCQGISSFIGAPIAGYLSDVTGDYSFSFYVAGIVMGLAGVICFPLRRIAAWEAAREQRKKGKELFQDVTDMSVSVDISS